MRGYEHFALSLLAGVCSVLEIEGMLAQLRSDKTIDIDGKPEDLTELAQLKQVCRARCVRL